MVKLGIDALRRAELTGSDAHAGEVPRSENPYLRLAGLPPAGELAAAWWRGWDEAEAATRQ